MAWVAPGLNQQMAPFGAGVVEHGGDAEVFVKPGEGVVEGFAVPRGEHGFVVTQGVGGLEDALADVGVGVAGGGDEAEVGGGGHGASTQRAANRPCGPATGETPVPRGRRREAGPRCG